MTSNPKVDRSKLLGFDRCGTPLYDIVPSEHDDGDGSVSRASGDVKGGSAQLGALKNGGAQGGQIIIGRLAAPVG
jgi:hypothetical protein